MGLNTSQQSILSAQSTPRSRIQIQQNNWMLLQKPEVNVTQMGSFAIYKNKVTGQVARQYTLHLDSKKKFQIYMEEFEEWRSQSHWNIIESKYIVSDQQSFSFSQLCTNFYPVKIFLQNPVVTLSEIKDIPPSESFHILLSALVGFQHLFEVFGYFPLRQPMIMINQFGVVKVWVNTDLSKNRPIEHNFYNVLAYDMQNPTRFIKQLIQLVDNNTDYGQQQISFRQFIHQKYDKKRVLTFSNCRKLLLNFAQQQKIDIPDSLMSILDLLFEKTNRSSISQQNIMSQDDHVLYGKNYGVNGYLLNQDGNQEVQQRMSSLQDNEFAQKPETNHQFSSQFQDQWKAPVPQYPESQAQLVKQVGNIVHNTLSQKNQNQSQSQSQSSNQLSSQQISYKNINEGNNAKGFSNNTQNQLYFEENNFYSQQPQQYKMANPPFYQLQQNSQQNAGYINFSHHPQNMHLDNPYHSLVQRQTFQKQSTIRQQAQQDSFLTSYKNSKFQSSRDPKRTSNHLKKTYKNMQTHRHTFSSHSDSKLNTQNFENFSPRQIQVRQDPHSQRQNNQSQQQLTKRSQKSIQFHTPNQTKQLDAQIARDLQQMMESMKS